MQKKAEIRSSSTELYDAECRLGVAKLHKPGAPSTAEALVTELTGNGIARALVYHADAVGYDPVEGNRRLLAEIAGYPALEPCWVLVPHHTGEFPPPDIVVAQMLTQGVRAARVFPRAFRFAFRLWNLGELLSALAAHRIPLWVDFGHDGWSEESIDYEGLHEVCDAFPTLPVVLVRPNIGTDRRVYALMAQHSNLYMETSYYTVHRGIELLCETFGPERVLFGTGLPHRAAGPAVTALAYSLIDDAARALVAGGNLARLLDLAGEHRFASV
ncbi:MAG: amidohydrolase family protein [Anaerolineae bacterium]|nr:amidohydrolase family protein [Anaerolineae bacterium]